MSGDMVDQSEGIPSVTPMKKKLSQATDAKKHISKAKATHSTKAKVVKEENEENVKPNVEAIKSKLKDIASQLDKDAIKAALQTKGVKSKEEAKKIATDAAESAIENGMTDEDYMAEGWLSKNKGAIGVALLVAALTGLGIKGEQQSQIIELMSEDSVLMSALKDPVWVGSIVSGLLGLTLTTSAVVSGQKAAKAKNAEKWANNAMSKGFTEDLGGGKLKNPKTGKVVTNPYA